MNRRGFLRALAAAPVAAVMAPAALAKPSFASGRLIPGAAAHWGIVGEIGPERYIRPTLLWPPMDPAHLTQQQFDEIFGASEESDCSFEEMDAYCDEPVEGEIVHAPPATP